MAAHQHPRPWDSPGKNTGVGCHFLLRCMKVKRESEVTQSCPTLSDPIDCSLPGSSAHGIFQARVLEWGAITFSNVYKYMYMCIFGRTCGLWDLSSPTRDGTHAPAVEVWSLPLDHQGKFKLTKTWGRYSCLENPMDGGAWWAAVHGVTKSWT